MLKYFRFIGFPLAGLFWLITSCRNWLYDRGILKSTEFDIPIIGVGNLAVGGSGKTPLVEHLLDVLSNQYTIAVLSRGYGRKTTGFKWVTPQSNATETGDEPLQIKKHYPDVAVAVCENRVNGVIQILTEKPETTLILLDDAFQHRAISPSINLLLSDYNTPWFKDFLMPVGRLRERRKGFKRADAIIYTKTPKNHQEYPENQMPVFYAKTQYKPLDIHTPVFGFSGLANNTYFKEYLSSRYSLGGFQGYPDHHTYTRKDVVLLKEKSNGMPLICTAKDKVKVDALDHQLDILVQEIALDIPLAFEQWLLKELKKHES